MSKDLWDFAGQGVGKKRARASFEWRQMNKAINFFQVNDESVQNMSTSQIIDLLRIIRGAICLTILRKEDGEDVAGASTSEGQPTAAVAESA